MSEQPSQRIAELPTEEGVDILKQCAALIEKFNRQHGIGAILAQTMIAQLSHAVEGHDESEDTVVDIEGNPKARRLQEEAQKAQDSLATLGLGLEQRRNSTVSLVVKPIEEAFGEPEPSPTEVGAKRGRLIIGMDDSRPKEIHFIVQNPPQLLRFLTSVHEDKAMEDDMEFKRSINTLVADIAGQVSEWGVRPGGQDALRSLIEQGDQIVEALKQLSCDTTRLEQLLANAQRGTLAEYRYLEEAKCFVGVNESGFRPSIWHTDSAPKYYREQWQRAIHAINLVKHNSRALPMTHRAVENLLESVQSAIADIQEKIKNSRKSQGTYYQTHGAELLTIAQEYRDLLESLQTSLRSQSSNKTFD